MELATWGVCEGFRLLVVFTAVNFIHASHEQLEKIGAEALGTDSCLSDVITNLLVEKYYHLDCRLAYLRVSMQESGRYKLLKDGDPVPLLAIVAQLA